MRKWAGPGISLHVARLSILKRYRRLSLRQRLLLAEALYVISASSAAIRLLPFWRVVGLAARGPNRQGVAEWSDIETSRQVRWAVEKIGHLVPWRAVCFQKGLTVHWMLRRRGVPSVLHYGVRPPLKGKQGAHVWVSVKGCPVIGGREASEFTCVATYPPTSEGIGEVE